MTESKKESQRGKAPKAGKGTGRKKGLPTVVVSVRLPAESVQLYKIDAAWLYKAVLNQLSKQTGLDFNADKAAPYDPGYGEIKVNDCTTKNALFNLLTTHNQDGDMCFKDDNCRDIYYKN